MTRVLAELLGTHEPSFFYGLQRLEAVSGHTSADIRLSTELERLTRTKLRELGLDPRDTAGAELYAALEQRLKDDDQRLSAKLQQQYPSAAAVHTKVAAALHDLPVPNGCFGLKVAVGRRLVAKNLPKQTMKVLGYRSFESMLRREHFLAVFAAAWLLESASWRKAILEAYKKLKAGDFEIRPVTILAPDSARWQAVANGIVAQKKQNIVGLREYGAVVILPFPQQIPPTATITSLLMALQELNTVRASSTYLKLCQVRPDFGLQVQMVIRGEPTLSAELLDSPVPWHIIQRYYSRFNDRFREDLFAPHIQQEDLTWHSVERALSFIEPSLAFWHHTAPLGMVAEASTAGPVSFNVIDVALNSCNQLPYSQRQVQYFRTSLWSELMIRYLKHEAVEQAVMSSLEAKLVDEEALV